ncbi:G_PROTEIN_RECEP_F1_2 domain-containing protein [Meloidogyne graminicola]|uniref:G_PROTEIN_RECEP_F1_2 domain-containing protein n=1 Tax=Meloidogyne graminicola TaxID=189291 RepID=A0A8S9ZKM1_9BILA|nr:G_PROTEIN_RECEP_F1_2 domain-containing protein [Meloidogyne graminicola]
MISPLWRLVFGSLFSLLTIVGLCGNALVIVAILGDRKMRKSVMNLLLLNLYKQMIYQKFKAFADALNLVTTSLEWTPTILLGSPTWIPWLPFCLCPVVRYLECVFLFTSILTQLMVCIERLVIYIAIVFPIHARLLCSRTNILIAIFIIWLTACLMAIPYALHNEISPDGSVCINVHASSEFWNKWFEFLSLYLLPCLAFIFLYSKICAVLWTKNRQLYEEKKSLAAKDEPRLSDPGSAASRASSSSAALLNAREEALRTRRNVVKMLVACVSVYFVCYSPIQAIFLSRGLFHVRIHLPYQFILLMNALAMLCSNPLLYTLFSRRFRTRIAALLCPYSFAKKVSAVKTNATSMMTTRRPSKLSPTMTNGGSVLLQQWKNKLVSSLSINKLKFNKQYKIDKKSAALGLWLSLPSSKADGGIFKRLSVIEPIVVVV